MVQGYELLNFMVHSFLMVQEYLILIFVVYLSFLVPGIHFFFFFSFFLVHGYYFLHFIVYSFPVLHFSCAGSLHTCRAHLGAEGPEFDEVVLATCSQQQVGHWAVLFTCKHRQQTKYCLTALQQTEATVNCVSVCVCVCVAEVSVTVTKAL